MADEAEEQVAEVVEDAGNSSALEEMQKMLDSAPEVREDEEEQAVEETEQAEGVEESAEGDDAVETEEVEETAEVADEGPSFLMKRAAVEAGIDPSIVGRAKDDAQLELLIEAAQKPERGDAPSPEEFTLSLELPEDDFAPDDPVRKVFTAIQEKWNKREQEVGKALSALTAFANMQLQREDQQAWSSLYDPFDKALDSFESPLLGTTGNLSEKQRAERNAIAEKYSALGANASMPAEELQRYAELAVSAVRKDLIEQRTRKQQATTRQQKQVTGGGGPQRTVQRPKTREDLLAEWDKSLRNGVALPN